MSESASAYVLTPGRNGEAPTAVRQIAVLGTAHPSILDYPADPASGWELWGMCKNAGHRSLRNGAGCAAYFEPHDRTLWADKLDAYRAITAPIYMQRVYADVPASREYPLERVLTEIPSQIYGRRDGAPFGQHRSSIGYMLAFAIVELGDQRHKPHDQRDRLGLWGVEMAAEGEYGYQKPNCEALLGYALGLGIDVVLPARCALMKAPGAYGYQPRGLVSGPVTFERLWREKREIEANLVLTCGRADGAAALIDWLTALRPKLAAGEVRVTDEWLAAQADDYARQRGELLATKHNLEGQLHKVSQYLIDIEAADRGIARKPDGRAPA